MVENKAKKSVVKEEKVKKENPEQLKESKEYKLKNLKDFYEKELISKEVYEKRQLEILLIFFIILFPLNSYTFTKPYVARVCEGQN